MSLAKTKTKEIIRKGINLYADTVFNDKYFPLLADQTRFLHLYGGAGSGKSVFAAQKTLYRIINEPHHRILVIRRTYRSHRQSTFQLLMTIINKWGLTKLFKINTNELYIKCINGNEILFAGIDDIEKLKSITDVTSTWEEEPTELEERDVWQIDFRMRGPVDTYYQNILSYNPINEYHWLNQHIHKRNLPNHKLIKSNHWDNKFLTQIDHDNYEAIRDKDETMYRIYALGEWATLEGLIFTQYQITSQMPDQGYEVIYGMDFGFAGSETALIKIYRSGKDLFFKELIYQTNLTSSDIIQLLKNLEIKKEPIICDSARPEMIADLFRAGFHATSANKAVNEGINYMKEYNWYLLDGECENFHKELQGYKWQDPKNGIDPQKPVKFRDHLIDAARYAIYTYGRDHWRDIPRIILDRKKIHEYRQTLDMKMFPKL